MKDKPNFIKFRIPIDWKEDGYKTLWYNKTNGDNSPIWKECKELILEKLNIEPSSVRDISIFISNRLELDDKIYGAKIAGIVNSICWTLLKLHKEIDIYTEKTGKRGGKYYKLKD